MFVDMTRLNLTDGQTYASTSSSWSGGRRARTARPRSWLPTQGQTDALRSDLAQNTQPWTIVFWHGSRRPDRSSSGWSRERDQFEVHAELL